MKKNVRCALFALLIILLVTVTILLGGAVYLLGYALSPGDRSRNVEQTWHDMDEHYPGMIAWRDSLAALHLWRDTLIKADDGATLHAYYVKNGQPTARTAVLIHGYTDNAVRMAHLGRMYLDSIHFNLLLPDLRNAGESDGDHFQMGWYDRLDVKRWAKTAPTLFGDSVRMVVHGISMGAATTMMLSGERDLPTSIKAFVEDCGYTSVDDQFSKEITERFGLPRFPLVPLASRLCRLKYGWTFEEASSLEAVKQCDRPMLFIHGDNDNFVPTCMVYPLYAAKRGEKQLWIAPHSAHAMSYHDHPNEYLDIVRKFLKGKL